MKFYLFFLALFLISTNSFSNDIVINITGYKDSKSLIDKTSQCNLTLDITNNSYGTIYWLDVEVDVIDDRGEKVKVVGFDNTIGNSSIIDRKPIPLGKTVSFKSDMTLQTQCKFIRNFKFTKVKPKFCNIRMLPEKVDCLNLIKAKVSF